MFKITENNILKDFSVRYEDEYHNRVRFARLNDADTKAAGGFYARLRFNNENVTVPVIKVPFPVNTDDRGLKINLSFKDGTDHSGDRDVQAAISGITELINRWIFMVSDVMALDFIPKMGGDPEAAAKAGLKNLTKYEELKDVDYRTWNRQA